mmetsp:Transcript_6470/g.13499  ORF Transcript_6470/g.13499 Transcript_6470/m.13499 type:complete len:241 (+) Transcript_6470:506-1228(+)
MITIILMIMEDMMTIMIMVHTVTVNTIMRIIMPTNQQQRQPHPVMITPIVTDMIMMMSKKLTPPPVIIMTMTTTIMVTVTIMPRIPPPFCLLPKRTRQSIVPFTPMKSHRPHNKRRNHSKISIYKPRIYMCLGIYCNPWESLLPVLPFGSIQRGRGWIRYAPWSFVPLSFIPPWACCDIPFPSCYKKFHRNCRGKPFIPPLNKWRVSKMFTICMCGPFLMATPPWPCIVPVSMIRIPNKP